MDLRSQMADLPMVSATPVRSEEGVRRSWMPWMNSQEATLSNSTSPCARCWQISGSGWPLQRRFAD